MKKYNGKIFYKLKKSHSEYIMKDKDKLFVYTDIYIIDEDQFYSDEEIKSYIKNDLQMVANGGYGTTQIKDVFIHIIEL